MTLPNRIQNGLRCWLSVTGTLFWSAFSQLGGCSGHLGGLVIYVGGFGHLVGGFQRDIFRRATRPSKHGRWAVHAGGPTYRQQTAHYTLPRSRSRPWATAKQTPSRVQAPCCRYWEKGPIKVHVAGRTWRAHHTATQHTLQVHNAAWISLLLCGRAAQST